MRRLLIVFIVTLFSSCIFAKSPAAQISDLQDKLQQANQQNQALTQELSQYKEASAVISMKLQTFEQTQQQLETENQTLRDANTELARQIQILSFTNHVQQNSVIKERHLLPSFSKSLMLSTHKNLYCRHGSCQLVDNLPIAKEDQALSDNTADSIVYSRYFMPVLITGIVLIIFILVVFIATYFSGKNHDIPKYKPHKNEPKEKIEQQEEAIEPSDEDYEAVSTGNEMDSKLDMARALIEMDEKKAARTALQEVMEAGNQRQCDEAQALLKKIDSQ